MKSHGVTIQMKPLKHYFHVVLFVWINFTYWNLEFGEIMILASSGNEWVNIISQMTQRENELKVKVREMLLSTIKYFIIIY